MESQLIQTSSEDEEKYIGIQGTYDSKGIIYRRKGKQDEKTNLIHIYVTLNSNNEQLKWVMLAINPNDNVKSLANWIGEAMSKFKQFNALKHLWGKNIRIDNAIDHLHELHSLSPPLNLSSKIWDYHISDEARLTCDLYAEEIWIKFKIWIREKSDYIGNEKVEMKLRWDDPINYLLKVC